MTSQESITRYWHAVELLQPQTAPKIEKRDGPYSSFLHDTSAGQPIVPWSPDSPAAKQTLPTKRVWSHTLFAHLYDSRDVAEKLKALYGADQGYKEPAKGRESALFAIKFTADGMMVQDSLILSSEAWFLGRALTGRDWTRGFDEDQDCIREQVKTLMGGQVSAQTLVALTNVIRNFLGVDTFFPPVALLRHRFRSTPIRLNKPDQEDDPLNSFLLSDLADVADSLQKGLKSTPLDHYLRRHSPQGRLHIDDDDASLPLIERLTPAHYPSGCWPAEHHLGLVHSQQLAVNTIMSTLADGEGLLGVNGPPGTGKTTLLRDLIAAIVTRRADMLASLPRASDAFANDSLEKANEAGNSKSIYKLNPALYGFEIVIASSNNGAVENVTLELPQRDKVDKSWLPEAEYFAELGELVSAKPAWGLISAALGSKTRRRTFVKRYFDGEAPPKAAVKATPDELLDDDNDWATTSDVDEFDTAHEPDEAAPCDKENEPRGLLGWLNAKADVTRTTAERQDIWQQAVLAYKAAKRRVDQLSADAMRINDHLKTLINLQQQVAEKSADIRQLTQKVKEAADQLVQLDEVEGKPAQEALQQCLAELQRLQQGKPGFWTNLFSLWGTQRRWGVEHKLINSKYSVAETVFERVKRSAQRLVAEQKALEKLRAERDNEYVHLQERLRQQTEHVTALAHTCKAHHLLGWLRNGVIGRGEAIELIEPWAIEGWRQARAHVFIQALKLHRCFFELEAKRIRANLKFINSVLEGGRFQGISRDAIRSIWASLFMVVPVLSSTFASFARSFGSLGVGEIGWLFVDEAGQATPQAAVGALWRARRAVLVGDPLQLKPIVTVSDAVLEHMRTRYGIDEHWLPNRQSAQTLADEATRWGRMMGPAEDKRWVGLPLVVHRRCDRPMYVLANRIAYDGVMVFGTLTPRPEKETKATLLTGWIQASGPSTGNWVPAEGDALKHLLAELRSDGVTIADICVITPFQAVRQRLKDLLPRKMVHGTIHTMQGKEAAVIIMVLGGNATTPGARNWVVSEPNLLNVAATRAKRRFYVIGDRNDWRTRSLFCDVMDLLPLQQLSTQATTPT